MRESGSQPPVSESELHGFVDGDLEPGRREVVRSFLANSPADAARVQAWRQQNETIRAAFASVETEPLHLPLPPPPGAGGDSGGANPNFSAIGSDSLATSQAGAFAGFRAWRERWSASLIALAFVTGALLATGGIYFIDQLSAPDGLSPASENRASARMDEALVTRTLSALLAFAPAPAVGKDPTPRLAPNGGALRSAGTALILPTLSFRGLKLAGVRVMPSELGEMLCMFYAKSEAANVALCVEKSDDPSDTVTRKSGKFPSAAVHWRQNGADYALAGALTEAELQKLAEEIRAEVEAFH